MLRSPRATGFEPVQSVADDHPLLASHLEKALQAEASDKLAAILSSKDWADFEKRRGEINGLQLAIDRCREARKSLQS